MSISGPQLKQEDIIKKDIMLPIKKLNQIINTSKKAIENPLSFFGIICFLSVIITGIGEVLNVYFSLFWYGLLFINMGTCSYLYVQFFNKR